ncbi:hypothetical protein [Bacillus wiedmannii]|uniref:hypothetical protein n=1 Tax=Bacillus wiedmannii TaxID=1890302 RepID=UPI00211E8C5E|nr:hypothetical protein [Bacillus wiedmannii]
MSLYLVTIQVYKKLFKYFQMLKFNFNEYEMDHCISEMVKEKKNLISEGWL